MAIFAIIGVSAGVATLRWSEQVADFFQAAARMLYSQKLVEKVYTARNFQWAGYGYIALGLLALGILVWRLIHGSGNA